MQSARHSSCTSIHSLRRVSPAIVTLTLVLLSLGVQEKDVASYTGLAEGLFSLTNFLMTQVVRYQDLR